MKKIIIIILVAIMLCGGHGVAKALDYSNIIGATINISIAVWGYNQNTRYGNFTGTLFALRGTKNLLSIRW